MTARILDGKAVADKLTREVRDAVDARRAGGRAAPGLAVVLVGENAASQVYVRNKRRTTDAVGMRSFAFDLPADASEGELLAVIDRLNADPSVNGILVQLPLPKQINSERIIERIDWRKDVDGFHPYNVGRLVLKMPTLRPCTPYGCMRLLAETGESLIGLHAVIIGQSNIVGRPMALELLMARCTVTVCHSATRDRRRSCAKRTSSSPRSASRASSRASGSSLARSSSTSESPQRRRQARRRRRLSPLRASVPDGSRRAGWRGDRRSRR
jgi:methylenetetrahydrofolate dehydrogenase (NADP+)/methenyltetrahydrofolate cyclohydrolase